MARVAELRANEVTHVICRFPSIILTGDPTLKSSLSARRSLSIRIFPSSPGDENAPADCVACCGTHPSSSGQIGIIKIYKVEKNKDMFPSILKPESAPFGSISISSM